MRTDLTIETIVDRDAMAFIYKTLQKYKILRGDTDFSMFKNALSGIPMDYIPKGKKIYWNGHSDTLMGLLFGFGHKGKIYNKKTYKFSGIATENANRLGKRVEELFQFKKKRSWGNYVTTSLGCFHKSSICPNMEALIPIIKYLDKNNISLNKAQAAIQIIEKNREDMQNATVKPLDKNWKDKAEVSEEKKEEKPINEEVKAPVMGIEVGSKQQEIPFRKEDIVVEKTEQMRTFKVPNIEPQPDKLDLILQKLDNIEEYLNIKSGISLKDAASYLEIELPKLYELIVLGDLAMTKDKRISVEDLKKFKNEQR